MTTERTIISTAYRGPWSVHVVDSAQEYKLQIKNPNGVTVADNIVSNADARFIAYFDPTRIKAMLDQQDKLEYLRREIALLVERSPHGYNCGKHALDQDTCDCWQSELRRLL